MYGYRFYVFIPLWLTLAVAASAADDRWRAQAELDQDSALPGEDIILNIRVGEQLTGIDPELEALSADFTVSGMTSGAFLRIQDGKLVAQSHWTIHLQAKRTGELTLPALQVGPYRTEALTLTVLPPSATAGALDGEVFLETALTPAAPYVQSQIRYTLRLLYDGELVNSVFDDMTISGARVQQLGEIESSRTKRAGRVYQVSERHLAIFADSSGPLQIPPVSVSGRLIRNTTTGTTGRSHHFQFHSGARQVLVRARPATYAGRDWLPAHSIDVQALWPRPPAPWHAGEPLTLLLLLEARGLTAFQLPPIELPPIEHASVYPGLSETTSASDSRYVTLRRRQQITIVPRRAGTLLIPEFKLDWWDTGENLQRMAFVSAQLLPILPASAALNDTAPAHGGQSLIPANRTVFEDPWRWSASLLLLLWLVSLYGWWRERRMI